MPFEPVENDLDLVALEERVLRRWADRDVFGESLRRREGAPEWVFYEGPPTANGHPHLGSAWMRAFKDLYPRYHTMRGRHVARKGGWDCHGLPVELEVEKELGFSGKQQIEEFGIAEFNRRCRESVHRYVEEWTALTTRIGVWLDTTDPFWTLSNEYIESVWWHIKQLWDKDLIYEGNKVVPYCGRCGTALSSHEVAQGYADVTEPSVYVRFPLADRDHDLLVWTTTPWTLVSNVAVAVGPEIRYVRARLGAGERDVVIAAARLDAVLGDTGKIVADVSAAELVGAVYERPLEHLKLPAGAPRVVAADFVSLDEGTGIVHLAPAFGEVDREVAEREHLGVLNPVDATGRFDDSVPLYAGEFVKDADARIIDELAATGRLFAVVDHTHSYPHCWRCATPLIYWAKPTWFARTSEHRDELLAQNESVDWHPRHIKHGRFGDWLANNVDWALSRDRFWGTPLPVWRCESCGQDRCVGSVAELAELAGRDLGDLDLHRPDIDDVVISCGACAGAARRVAPVLDAWFDSGAVPASQFHYPFEGTTDFDRRFPADFVCEAIDQTRGWFYSLLAVNTLVFGRAPYRNVVCLALIVDRDGHKMSKSRGNVVDPWVILNSQGADALRWYFFSAGSPWTNRRVDTQAIDEATRRLLVTLWNTLYFFVTYANLDGWHPGADSSERGEHVLDRWVRSRLHATIEAVTSALDEFDALRSAQAIEALVDDVSNWYVRRSRSRFWKASDPSAHSTLHECLTTVSLLLAPFCPFTADEVHRVVTGGTESVHLADWPSADPGARDLDLEDAMTLARRLVTLGRAARAEAGIKVRQPLPRAFALVPATRSLDDDVVAEIADELNVKHVEVVYDLEGLVDYAVLPNFRLLGPKLGPAMPRVKAALETVDVHAVRRALDEGHGFRLDLGGGEVVELGADEVELRARAHEELVVAQDAGIAVALETTLDDDLRLEGYARELVHGLNDLRKAKGFDLADRIRVVLWAPEPIAGAARRHQDWIASEVLAIDWTTHGADDPGAPSAPDHRSVLELDGVEAAATIDRL